jgi:CRP-like cAMP-binding protein
VSVLDELRALEEQIVTRLRELEPMVAEYQELRAAAERLGIEYAPGAAPSGASRKAPTRSTSTRRTRPTPRRRSRSRRLRRDQVLAAVRAQAGITVPDIGKRLGVDPTGLYRVVRQLEQEGEIVKDGRELRPAGE